MREVSRDEFFGLIKARRLDVHPHPKPDRSVWEFRNRAVLGETLPGWRGLGPKRYFLADPLPKEVGA